MLCLFIAACIAGFATPLITVVNMATQLLPVSLVDIRTDWIRQVISPINSLATVVVLALFVVMKFFRRIFS